MATKIPTRTATTRFDLGIDLETYSSVDINNGVYRYVESPDFEIMLFCYAFDDEEPTVVDFTSMTSEEIACWKKWVKNWLTCGEFKIRAYNAEFEMACLSKWLGFEIPAENWWDTQVTAATVGLPRSLKDVGIALGLDAESLKNPEGTALIRYFCVPCKPTGANGGRCRNRPSDAPDKWQRFIAYNKQDVIAERAIARKLARFEPSEAEHDAWILSVGINRRGVLCDRQMAENAVRISQEHTSLLMTELRQLTSLENPNSNMQLKEWLGLPDITKDTVTEALKTAEGDRKRVLELRRELGKTSVKKYEAMLGMMSPTDNRCRGVFSFYGANRTGRFTAKGIQLQNLPQNHIDMLKEARDLVCQGDRESLELLFGNVPDTLSQLIRTAFIAKPGHTFVVADFSAIEARVVAWLAGEKWRMDLFAAGGDIYCQSASKMFGVPVEKHGQNASLRQRGKVAELACGYGGGVGAMINMGGEKLGLSEEELKRIVDLWREASPHIVDMWWDFDTKAKKCVKRGISSETVRGITFSRSKRVLEIKLPSGRSLRYFDPEIGTGKFDKECIVYSGYEEGKWSKNNSYGPKIVENVTQAIARDCLVEAMKRVSKRYPGIVMHIHDEMVVEVPENEAEEALTYMTKCMADPISWAPGLLLRGEGYESLFYRK